MSDLLILENVSKDFERLRAVDNLSLSVPQGQIIGLVGPNGSGKSTLFNVIAGLLRPDGGRLLFDGHDITARSPDSIFQLGLARSFQDPALFFRMTVLDNMLLPAKGQRGERPTLAPIHRVGTPGIGPRRVGKRNARAGSAPRELFPTRRKYFRRADEVVGLGTQLNEPAENAFAGRADCGRCPKIGAHYF